MRARTLWKAVAVLVVCFVAICVISHFSKPRGNREIPDDLAGIFAGDAGMLRFLPDRKVEVALTEESLWILEGRANNETYGYVFLFHNEMISYDKADAFCLYDENETFARFPCVAAKDELSLRGEGTRAVFLRESD